MKKNNNIIALIISNGCIMLYSLAVVLYGIIFLFCVVAQHFYFLVFEKTNVLQVFWYKNVWQKKTTEGLLCAGWAVANGSYWIKTPINTTYPYLSSLNLVNVKTDEYFCPGTRNSRSITLNADTMFTQKKSFAFRLNKKLLPLYCMFFRGKSP